MGDFDWTLIIQAAEKWMADNPHTLPKWLLLPASTNDEIVAMAQEIYDVPTILDDIEVPWFTTIDPAPAPPPEPLHTVAGKRFSHERLMEAAQQGTLTAEDIKAMSMEEYAQVRHLLLNAARNAGPRGVFRS